MLGCDRKRAHADEAPDHVHANEVPLLRFEPGDHEVHDWATLTPLAFFDTFLHRSEQVVEQEQARDGEYANTNDRGKFFRFGSFRNRKIVL